MRATVILLCVWLVKSDPYPYSWTVGNVKFTCELGDSGWKQAGTSCFFAFLLRNQTWTDANQMCRSYVFKHSHGSKIQNWLIARSLLNVLPSAVYWTGLRESETATRLQVGWEFTDASIYNPIWAPDQPSWEDPLDKCVALDLTAETSVGWRLLNCSTPLATLCETFACMDDEFRCLDNSRCIPRSAVRDGVDDCGDSSDERTLPVARLIATPGRTYSSFSISDCQDVVLNTRKGTVTSPNYPGSYPTRTFCRWDIIAQPGEILVINIEDVDLLPEDTVTLEGDSQVDSFTLKNEGYPLSYVTKSTRIRMVFSSGGGGTARGFRLHYFSKAPSDVCRLNANGFIYESWLENMDCVYVIQHPDETSYTVLEVLPRSIGETAVITANFKDVTYNIKRAGTTELLVIPSNIVRVQIRNAWTSESYTTLSVSYRFLKEDPLELALILNGFALRWFSSAQDCTRRSLRLVLHPVTEDEYRSQTITLSGVMMGGDAVTVIVDGQATPLISPSTFRAVNSQRDTHVLISKRSSSFQLSAQFSRDCVAPVTSPRVRISYTSGNALGSVIQYACEDGAVEPLGPSSAECLIGGEWSAQPPICRESELVFCSLPVVQDGYVISVTSSCEENPYCDGAELLYGCDFGKLPGTASKATCSGGSWTPLPACANAVCPFLEKGYRNATLDENPSLEPLSHVDYGPPKWSSASHPFRVCALEEHGTCYNWLDYNFKFQTPICRSYPVKYGQFQKSYYNDGETASITCVDGFSSNDQPVCSKGEWSSYNVSCEEPPFPENACQNGHLVKLNPGYTCKCSNGYEMITRKGLHTCEDIDECARHFALCDPDSECVNRIGGYTCKCAHGKELFTGQPHVDSRFLTPDVSCIWKTCSITSPLIDEQWLVVDRKPHYKHGEVARFLCALTPRMFAEFEGRCNLGYWDVKDPCSRKCSKNLRDPDLVSGYGEASLLERMQVSCRDAKKVMIGSHEVLCGRDGQWLSKPICETRHCPDLDGLLSPALVVTYSDSSEKGRVGSTASFYCPDDLVLKGPRMIECVNDGDFSAKWTREPPTCSRTPHMKVSSRLTYEESTISSLPYEWEYSPDWHRYNSTWIGLMSNEAISYLRSPAIRLKSDSLRLVVHIQHLTGSVTIGTFSSNMPSSPPIEAYTIVASASKPGFLEVALDDLKGYLSVLIFKYGSATIQSVKLLYTQCDAATINGASLTKSMSFSRPRQVPAKCGGAVKTFVRALCSPVLGWTIQTDNPCCAQCQRLSSDPTVACTYRDCANGNCTIVDGKKTCNCRQGFHNVDAECVPDSCKHTFCSKTGHGVCEEHSGTGTCRCGPGFSKSTFCELEDSECPTCEPPYSCRLVISHDADAAQHQCICAVDKNEGQCPWDPCQKHNCGPHGECIPEKDMDIGYWCKCDSGWMGQECRSQITCVSTEDVYLCNNGGNCTLDHDGRAKCDCGTRFTGPHCETVPDPCEGVKCYNGGSCEPTENGHFCYCVQGFTGPSCEAEVDECGQQNPCQQGSCGYSAGQLWCNCSVGWTGEYCDTQLDLCQSSSPCQHGRCRGDLPGNRICDCGAEYRGEYCDEMITYCQLKPCFNNGTCVEQFFNGYSCECLEGFTGNNCETKIDLCEGWLCLNNGTCIVHRNVPVCHCQPRFSGEHCEIDISSPCDDVTCLNGGTCYVENDEAFCKCLPGYTGARCETHLNPCDNVTCLNGGTCYVEHDEAFCKCLSGYTGARCEIHLETCDNVTCLNGGTCYIQDDEPLCKCVPGYTGPRCETHLNPCDNVTCLNGGTCYVKDDEAFCRCTAGYTGTHCETRLNPCDEVTCLHGGSCYVHENEALCACLADYTGERCETHLDLCVNFTCSHNGTCIVEDHAAKCLCQSGYGGLHCDKELTKCEEFPEPLLCLNGGSCIVTNHQQHCECALGFFGNNCDVFGRSCAAITCQGGGTCVNDTTLQGHCICPPERTGEFCETEKTSSFNLYFNGQRSSQEVVSKDFSSTLLREFTLCAWVFYAPIEQPSTDVGLGAFLQLNTTSRTPILSIDNTGVTINKNFYIDVKLSTMAWHHVCVRSPLYQADVDRPIWTVFLDGVLAANTSYPLLDVTADIRCLIQLSSSEEPRFRGEISLAQLYIAYLNDTDIARMAFQCSNWTAAPNPDLHLKWTDFTTIQRNNPGVMALYPGLCDVSDCLPGRSSCNTKDKIPPLVTSCPRNIRKVSANRLTRVDWNTTDMFTDNVGIASIKSNYRSGQSFTWGYYRVVYTASDAAGNTAACAFSVVVSPSECQTPHPDSQFQGDVSYQAVNGTDAVKTARVNCSDTYFPRSGPEFYVCDVMGQWDRTSFWSANSTYTFPSCGATKDPLQNINGTLDDSGDCSLILQSLLDSLLNETRPYCSTFNCTGQVSIDSDCPPTLSSSRVKRRTIRDEVYSFHFYVNVNSTRSLLRDTIDSSLRLVFPSANLTTTDSVICDDKFPHLSMSHGNASCADCSAGQYWHRESGSCVRCPEDTYRSIGDPLEECRPCPANKSTSGQTGQKDNSACHDVCDAGFYYDDGAKKCRQCPRGTYQEKRGGLSCLPCPSDSTTVLEGAKNATDCSVKCDPGQEMDDAANCVPCAKGTYWVSGSFTGCTDCPQGLTTSGSGSKDVRDCEIVDCPRGTHVHTNRTDAIDPTRTAFDTLCQRCGMGTYQDERNQTTCKPCTPTSNCPLVNECSPLLSNTCEDGSSCILMELGIYSCSTVVIKPIPESNNWILWVIVPLVVLVIMTALVVAGWIYRHALYTTICCRKLDPKLLESREYYRPASRPVVANRIVEVEGYRNYPPRRRDTVRPTEVVGTVSQAPQREAKPTGVLSSASIAPPRRSIEDPNMVRLRERHLPPPIITSKVELDLLEEQARRKTLSTSVLLTPCRSLGSHIATGVSSESPGPSISAQLPLPRRRTYSNGQPPARPPTEDPSISCSLHWSESSPTASNGAFGDNDAYDDDEDYFG